MRCSSFEIRLPNFILVVELTEDYSSLLTRRRGPFECRHSRFDILLVDALQCKVEYALRRPKPNCGGNVGIGHQSEDRNAGYAGRLLLTSDGLKNSFPARSQILGVELGLLQPPPKRLFCDARGTSSVLDAGARQ